MEGQRSYQLEGHQHHVYHQYLQLDLVQARMQLVQQQEGLHQQREPRQRRKFSLT